MRNPFEDKTDNNLKSIYEEILIAREEGLRPRNFRSLHSKSERHL